MSAKHALLGLLLQGSAYPYQLGDRLQGRLGPAWIINSGQLYQTIERLEREGLIEPVEGSAESRKDRHIFAITDSGVGEFERWFEEASSGARLLRRPLLVKITLAGPERLKDALEQIDAYELDCAERLKELSQAQETIAVRETKVRADRVLLRLNLTADIAQLEGELQWARHAYEMVSWLISCPDAIWPAEPERPGTVSDGEHRGARAELFGRMATGQLRAAPEPGNQKQNRQDERADPERSAPATSTERGPGVAR
jgi:DNA-binding PadR family transcriptional regulator